MTGLREALEKLRSDLDQSYPGRAQYDIPSTVIDRLGVLLAAHPAEPAPVASRERVIEALSDVLPYGEASVIARTLLAAGVFRSEAIVKAEALEEIALAWATAGGSDVVSAFLDARAKALRAGAS